MESFPIYILRLGSEDKIVFSQDRIDIGHIEFWEQTVAQIVASYYRLPLDELVGLPYCQRRARIFGACIYYGEKQEAALLLRIRDALKDDELIFCYDDHECRLKSDVLRFEGLLKTS